MVYVASIRAKKGIKSLNECLYQGTITLPNMCGVLIRFCMYFLPFSHILRKLFFRLEQENECDFYGLQILQNQK